MFDLYFITTSPSQCNRLEVYKSIITFSAKNKTFPEVFHTLNVPLETSCVGEYKGSEKSVKSTSFTKALHNSILRVL